MVSTALTTSYFLEAQELRRMVFLALFLNSPYIPNIALISVIATQMTLLGFFYHDSYLLTTPGKCHPASTS